MRLVYVASPYSGDTAWHERYALAALRDCLARREAPYAPHLLYPAVLDDNWPDERRLGMDAGLAWLRRADALAVYTDLGLSRGMRAEIDRALRLGVPIETRCLGGWQEKPTRGDGSSSDGG